MNQKLLALTLMLGFGLTVAGVCQAGIVTSTVNQDGNKYVYPGFGQDPDDPTLKDEEYKGSASRIGIFEFDFPSNPANLSILQARIQMWAQLPDSAIGDAAPWIVFAAEGMVDGKSLYRSLLNGETNRAISTDIRITYNQPDRGPGVVQKKMILFQDLTREQGLALSSILAANPNNRLEAWLVSDSLTNITVPAVGESFEFINGMIVTTFQPFSSTLDLIYVPEPSTGAIFIVVGGYGVRRGFNRLKKRMSKTANPKEQPAPCFL